MSAAIRQKDEPVARHIPFYANPIVFHASVEAGT